MGKTYKVEAYGKRFVTTCRTDGFWSINFFSKNKKSARKKGDEFVSGIRTATRKYVTPYGEMLNSIESQRPRAIPAMTMTSPAP